MISIIRTYKCRLARVTKYYSKISNTREQLFPEIMAIIELEVQAKVDPDQGLEIAQIGIEFIVISVGSMIILHRTVQVLEKKRKLNSFNKC